MRFGQAYYTRSKKLLNESGTGLGIAAASDIQNSFFTGAMSIGSKFNTEDSKESAEFLVYSDYFQRYVGVRVSPSAAKDGGTVNKICHMFIPENQEKNPDLYCLDYSYESDLPKNIYLEKKDIFPCLGKEDFSRILKKYEFDTKKLASFLNKLYPVLFGEKNLLLIVLDEEIYRKNQFVEVAREITWLANYLVPDLGEKAWYYRKNLSYGVNTTDNIGIVNLAFSSNPNLHDYCFFLDTKESESVLPVYENLARSAMSSYEEFLAFVTELHDCGAVGTMGSKELQLKYVLWKFSYDMRVEPNEIPATMEFIRREAVHNSFYRQFLFCWMLTMKDIPHNELVRIWQQIIEVRLKDELPEEDTLFLEVIQKMLKLMYYKNLKNYTIFVRCLPVCIRKKILKSTMDERNSFVWDHVKHLTSFEECQEFYEIYDISGAGEALVPELVITCENLMKEAVTKADRKSCICYIKLELLREQILGDEFESTVTLRCRNLDRLSKEAPQFYEKLVAVPVYIERIHVLARIKEAQVYDRLLKRENVTINNLRELSELLYEARKRLGVEIEQVKVLEDEYGEFIEKLEKEKTDYVKKIQKKQYQKLENDGEIVYLKKENLRLEQEIEQEMSVCERLKQVLKTSKEILTNGKV